MDFRIGEILSLMVKTTPFLIFRFLIYFGITVTYMLGIGVGAGIGYFIGHIGDDPGAFGVWGGIVGFGLVSTVLYFLREYLLYLVKAGHIAVLVELMAGKELPGGRGQIDYAQKLVRERFVESSVLFGLDQMIKVILKNFNRVFFTIASFLPIPGVHGLVKFINTVINLSLTYLDEVVLAYFFRTASENPWKSSQTALVLYAQNYKVFLKNAFFMALFIWGLTLVVFLVILLPVFALVSFFPAIGGPLTLIIALVLAWGIKQAIIEPIAMTALMQVFFAVTEGQIPNPEWEDKLSTASDKFIELKNKAIEWAKSKHPGEKATDSV